MTNQPVKKTSGDKKAKVFTPPENANIIFIGKDETDKSGKVLKSNPPIRKITGAQKIILPSEEEQRQGAFFHENAGQIIKMFPFLYKRFKAEK